MTPPSLPSWNDGLVKSAIVDFVRAVTTDGDPDFVPVPERVAVFDNDGTLWAEQPVQVQFMFAMDRLAQLGAADPSLRERQPYRAFLERDLKTIAGFGKRELLEFAYATHTGTTTEDFLAVVRAWLDKAEHPKLHRPFTQCVYAPQLELLDYLRSHGFKTFIVSGGGTIFIRAFSEKSYGIPPEQVIASSAKTKFEVRDGRAMLVTVPELASFDDREVKAENIHQHIGRRPIFAAGNSDGDLAMMRYTLSSHGRSLALLLHHDDAAREFAYDRDFRLSPLAEGLDHAAEYGITLVSMAKDWRTVFP